MSRRRVLLGILAAAALSVWVLWPSGESARSIAMSRASNLQPPVSNMTQTATFAGGCFWCVEEAFEAVPGVSNVVSGYIGGDVANPTYEQVSAGGTGHAEAVQMQFDPERVSYEQLLEVFWHNVDPTVPNRQFCDVGSQYRSAIFYHDDAQREAAERTKAAVEDRLGTQIYTEIVPAGPFYTAETYHQNYYEKNPVRYKFYKWNCGRAQRLEQLWGEKG